MAVFIGTLGLRAEDAPRLEVQELLTDGATAGDGGNAWGGHQGRIVRTRDGVFTAWSVPGRDDLHREWRLAWRRDERWSVVASGPGGREPVHLLASPDGTLHVIGWPEGKARLWSGRPSQGKLALAESAIPGQVEGDWPYGSAGVDAKGTLCVLSSDGEKPGAFRWAVRAAGSNEWTAAATATDYRHCYSYVFPDGVGDLLLVSSRDVRWETLGLTKPFDQFDYVFNAFGLWRRTGSGGGALRKLAMVEERPTRKHPAVICNAQNDAYLDSTGRLHVIYLRQGPNTGGDNEVRYAVFDGGGGAVSDARVPWEAGPHARIYEDDRNRFYLLGSDGLIFGGAPGKLQFDRKTRLKLRGAPVERPGFSIAVPRTGTPRSGIIDFVYPSAGAEKWTYGRIRLHD